MATRSFAVSNKKANSAISKLAISTWFKKFKSLDEVLRAMTDTLQNAQGNGDFSNDRKRVVKLNQKGLCFHHEKFGNNPRRCQLPGSCKF